MRRSKYSTDLSDSEWACLKLHLPASKKRGRGRPKIHSLRDILDAIFYVLKSGCPWRLLPRCFPPWKTVYHWFRKPASGAYPAQPFLSVARSSPTPVPRKPSFRRDIFSETKKLSKANSLTALGEKKVQFPRKGERTPRASLAPSTSSATISDAACSPLSILNPCPASRRK